MVNGRLQLLDARRLAVSATFAAAIFGGALIGVILALESDLPQVSSLEDFRPNTITQVFARDGSLVGQFAIERRVIVGFNDIPPVLRNAIVAVEDADFWKHLGVNPWTIPGAALANLRSGRIARGFSTLTMQLSRLLFLTPEKTYERKIKESILAFQIEKRFTKEEIFTLYCNQVYFGHGRYGVEAASQFFLGKSVRDLDLPDAALLAGLIQNPPRLSPVEHPDRAVQRRNIVLERMQQEKYISQDEADRAKLAALNLQLKKEPSSIAPHFLEEVRRFLEKEYGSQRIYQGGLRVHTTLDVGMQRAAVAAMREGLRRLDRQARGYVPCSASILHNGDPPDLLALDDWSTSFGVGDVVKGVVLQSERHSATVRIGEYRAHVTPEDVAWAGRRRVDLVLPRGCVAPFRIRALSDTLTRTARVELEQEPLIEGALVALDVRTGAIRAMVGGFDFERSKFNRATQAYRQVGSAFKPILYTAAIEHAGWTPASIIIDAPISFPNPATNQIWTPHNYDRNYLGPITLRHAIEKSRNIPAIKTLQAIGVEAGIRYAKKMGLSREMPPYLPIAIGAGEATPLELTAAFATYANQGLRMEPFMIERVTDQRNNVIEERRPRAIDAIRADTAYLITSLLRGVVERGTATRARSLKRPIAGKTGTTNDWTDGWFVGYEPSLAAGVWVGFDEPTHSLGRGQDGARTALPIWMDFWKKAMQNEPIEEYPIPGNIVFIPVDSMGHPARPGEPGVYMEAFIAGSKAAGML
ncbi:MAG: PBP1A family penicillin-binding protein [Vicinamibacteria bacterium]|nr:PBP1A family penicillin-binding protein [Vicinamibacteria bacterium]